jgi:DNA-binding CsgD family transcriptional regulator
VTGSNISEFAKQDSAFQANLEGGSFSQGRGDLPSADSLARILDELNIAVILTDMNARVLHMNNDAKDIIRSKVGLSVADGALKAGTDLETVKLRQLIRTAAINGEDPVNQTRHFGMALGDCAETGPQSIIIAGFSSNGSDERAREAHAVLFATQSKHYGIPHDILRVLFGLTSSEATLASEIIEGRGLEPAANKCSMGINTARTHLKKVFSKTQTGRQAELVRLLLRSVGFVRFD